MYARYCEIQATRAPVDSARTRHNCALIWDELRRLDRVHAARDLGRVFGGK